MSSRSLTGSTLVRRRFSPVLSLFSVQLLSSFFGLVKSPPCFGRRLRCDVHVRDADAVRDPTTWTILQKDGPNHLRLRYNVLPAHQMALITSGCAPFRALLSSKDATVKNVLTSAKSLTRDKMMLGGVWHAEPTRPRNPP